jgi:hypothetical protein
LLGATCSQGSRALRWWMTRARAEATKGARRAAGNPWAGIQAGELGSAATSRPVGRATEMAAALLVALEETSSRRASSTAIVTILTAVFWATVRTEAASFPSSHATKGAPATAGNVCATRERWIATGTAWLACAVPDRPMAAVATAVSSPARGIGAPLNAREKASARLGKSAEPSPSIYGPTGRAAAVVSSPPPVRRPAKKALASDALLH